MATMAVGERFTLKDDEVLDVEYIRTLQTQPKKSKDKNGRDVVPVDYAQMRYGSTSFTINTEKDVAVVADEDQRDDICAITLEISEFEEEDIDDAGNAVLDAQQNPLMKKRRGLQFVSLMTYKTKIARDTRRAQASVAAEGAAHAARVQWGLTSASNVDEVAQKLKELMDNDKAGAQAAEQLANEAVVKTA